MKFSADTISFNQKDIKSDHFNTYFLANCLAAGMVLFFYAGSLFAASSCDTPIQLVTANGTAVGNIIATVDSNSNNALLVKITTINGNKLIGSQVQAGPATSDISTLFSLNKAGNPQIGKFASNSVDNSSDTSIHTNLPGVYAPGQTIYLAVHADMQTPTGSAGAWSSGTQFNSGKNWASYATCTLHQNPVAMDDNYSFFVPDPTVAYPLNINSADLGVVGNDTGEGALSVVLDQGLTYDDPVFGANNGTLVPSAAIAFTLNPNGTFAMTFNASAPHAEFVLPADPNGTVQGSPYKGTFLFKYHVVDSYGASSNVATAIVNMKEQQYVAFPPPTYSAALNISNSENLVVPGPNGNLYIPANQDLPVTSTSFNPITLQTTYTINVTGQSVNLVTYDTAYLTGGTTTTSSLQLQPLTVTGCATNPCPVTGYQTVSTGTSTTQNNTNNFVGLGSLFDTILVFTPTP